MKASSVLSYPTDLSDREWAILKPCSRHVLPDMQSQAVDAMDAALGG